MDDIPEIESIDRLCKPLSRWYRFKHWFKEKTNPVFHWYDIYGIDREPLPEWDEYTPPITDEDREAFKDWKPLTGISAWQDWCGITGGHVWRYFRSKNWFVKVCSSCKKQINKSDRMLTKEMIESLMKSKNKARDYAEEAFGTDYSALWPGIYDDVHSPTKEEREKTLKWYEENKEVLTTEMNHVEFLFSPLLIAQMIDTNKAVQHTGDLIKLFAERNIKPTDYKNFPSKGFKLEDYKDVPIELEKRSKPYDDCSECSKSDEWPDCDGSDVLRCIMLNYGNEIWEFTNDVKLGGPKLKLREYKGPIEIK